MCQLFEKKIADQQKTLHYGDYYFFFENFQNRRVTSGFCDTYSVLHHLS